MPYISKAKGERAMEYIADYPLYASTCGITYEEAVKVAKALNPKWEDELAEMKAYEAGLTSEQKNSI